MWNICRTCMTKNEEMISIFNREKSPSINDKLMNISSLLFLPNDRLPSEICITCVKTLEITYSFKEQVIRCNNALQKQTRRSKLLGRLKEEETETEYEAEEVSNVASGATNIIVASNIDDHASKYHDPLLPIDDKDPSSECFVSALHLHGVCSPTDDIRGSNSLLEEPCTKSEEVEVEEHGVQFEDNYEITPKYEADDDGFSSEDDLPLTEVHISSEIYLDSEGMKKLGDMEYLSSENLTQPAYCEEIFDTLSNVEILTNMYTGKSSFKCQHCHASFKDYTDMIRHICSDTDNAKMSKAVRCEVCKNIFTAPHYLKMHMRSHSVKRNESQHSNVASTNSSSQKKPISSQTRAPKPNFHQCEICGKTLRKGAILRTHMRSHKGKRLYECQQCDAKYMIMSKLIAHTRRKHTIGGPPRRHKCEICGKAYESPSDLKIHMRYHTGERPFKCQQCDAAFVRGSELYKHIRWYHSEGTPKPHKCEDCEKTFRSFGGLTKHKKSHSAERPFKCNHCNAGFKQSWTLKQHVLTHAKKHRTNRKS